MGKVRVVLQVLLKFYWLVRVTGLGTIPEGLLCLTFSPQKTMLHRMQVGPVHKHCKSIVPINLYVSIIPDGQILVGLYEIIDTLLT